MSKTLDLLQSQGKVAARYDFKAGSLLDKSGNGNTLVASNSPKWQNTNRGRGVNCDPQTATLHAPDAASLRLTEGVFILAGDFKKQYSQQIYAELTPGAGTWILFYSTNGASLSIWDGTNSSSINKNIVGKKYLAVRFKTGRPAEFFLDGVFGSAAAVANAFTAPTGGLSVGSISTSSGGCQNPITDFILLNSADVTDQQISQIYNELMQERGSGDPKTTNFHASVPVDTAVVPADGSALGTDMDMEAATTAAWTDFQAVSSKVAGTRTGGSGSKILRLSFDGSNASGLTYQAMGTLGKKYRIRGWCRGTGASAVPRIGIGSVNFFVATSSATWQYFDVVLADTTLDGRLRLQCNELSNGDYVEYDDLSVVETTELVSDGDMEATGTASWTANSSVLSKITTSPYAGTQALRIAYNATSQGYATQSIATAGKTYTVSGRARSDGSVTPMVLSFGGGSVLWTGTTSTSWQEFNFKSEAPAGGLMLYIGTTGGLSAGKYVEFDSISVKEVKCLLHWDMSTLTGDGKMLDRSGNGRHGTISQVQKVYSAPFDGMQFNQSLTSNISVDDGYTNTISGNQNAALSIWVNTDDLTSIPVLLSNSNGQFVVGLAADAIYVTTTSARSYTISGINNKKLTHIYFEKTGSGDLGNLYVNNVLQTSYTGTLGSMPTTASSFLRAGAYTSGALYHLLGKLFDLRLYSSNLTTAERTKLYLDGAKRLVLKNDLKDAPVSLATVTAGIIPGTNWEVTGGSAKISEDTSRHWLESVSLGANAIPSKHSFGTWKFRLKVASFAAENSINFISSVKTSGYAANTGYAAYVWSDGSFGILRCNGGGSVGLIQSAAGYIAINTEYEAAITRTIGGIFKMYIKGGAYATWTLMGTSIADVTYTTSKFFESYLFNGGKISGLYIFAGVIDPTVNGDLIPN